MDRDYFARFCFKKYCAVFVTILFVLLSGLARAQWVWPSRNPVYDPSKARSVITVCSIEPLSSLDSLFISAENLHVPSSEEPKKYFFYIS